MASLRLMRATHGDQLLAEWDQAIPESVCRARRAFAENRIGRMAFRLDGPGQSGPIGPDEELPEDAPDVLIVPAIQGGSPVEVLPGGNTRSTSEKSPIRFRLVRTEAGDTEYFTTVREDRVHDPDAAKIVEDMGLVPDTEGWFDQPINPGWFAAEPLAEVVLALVKAGHLVTFSCPMELRER